jgi:hypothetical protein
MHQANTLTNADQPQQPESTYPQCGHGALSVYGAAVQVVNLQGPQHTAGRKLLIYVRCKDTRLAGPAEQCSAPAAAMRLQLQ